MAISTNGTVLARVAGALYNTQMSNATYDEVKLLDPASLANALYARDFNMVTDATVATTLLTNLGLTAVEGLANWVAAQLTAAGANKGAKVVDMLNGFAQMTADTTYGAAATAFNTKVDAALALSQTVGNKGGTFAAAGVVVPTPVGNAAFTLTTAADAFTGGAGDDTFTALISGTATIQTATSGDVLAGGAGNDTLALTVVDSANPGLLQTDSIETVNVRGLADTTVDTLLYAGVTSVNSSGSSNAVTVNNGALSAEYGLKSTVSGQAAHLTVNFRGADVAGTADTAKVVISGVGSSVLEAGNTSPTTTTPVVTLGTGVEGVTVAASDTNFVNVTAPALATKLTVTGAGTNTITPTGFAQTSTIDASAATGTNTFKMGTNLTTGDTITGGTGTDTVETVNVGTQSSVSMSGVETLRLANGSTGTLTFAANPVLTTVDFRAGNNANSLTGLTTLPNLKYTGDASLTYSTSFGALTLNTTQSGTSDTVAIAIGNQGNTIAGGYTVGAITASGIENITITQSDMLASQTTTVGQIANTGLKTISVTTPGAFTSPGVTPSGGSANNVFINTQATSAPGTAAGTTASTTGSNTVTSVDLSGVAGGSGTIVFQDGTFAAAATVKAAAGGGTYTFGSETATDVITFTGATTSGANIVSVQVSGTQPSGTAGTTASGSYVVTFNNSSDSTFDGSKLAAATSGNTVTATGGSGADSLVGGANSDVLSGGAGADSITGGKGADVITGGTGSDTFFIGLGVAAVNAGAEVQTIDVVPSSVSTATSAEATFVVSGGGLSSSVMFIAPSYASSASASVAAAAAVTAEDSLASALNANANGKFVAASASGKVTVTFATAQGNVADFKIAVYNSSVAAATTATAAGYTVNDATPTAGTNSAASTASDSTASSLGLDQITYISTDADKIALVTGSIALHGSVATSLTAAALNSAGLVSFASMTSNNPTSLSAAVTLAEAALQVSALVSGHAAALVYNGQAYLYITDAVAGVGDGDLLVTLTGVTSLTNGITVTSNVITAIS
jgi:S-layer protein